MSLAGFLLAGMLLSAEAIPQPSPGTGTRLKVFLDCSSSDCFEDYLREEVEIVDYVPERNDADVHVLVTSAETVARGREYTLSFRGGVGSPASRATGRSIWRNRPASANGVRL